MSLVNWIPKTRDRFAMKLSCQIHKNPKLIVILYDGISMNIFQLDWQSQNANQNIEVQPFFGFLFSPFCLFFHINKHKYLLSCKCLDFADFDVAMGTVLRFMNKG